MVVSVPGPLMWLAHLVRNLSFSRGAADADKRGDEIGKAFHCVLVALDLRQGDGGPLVLIALADDEVAQAFDLDSPLVDRCLASMGCAHSRPITRAAPLSSSGTVWASVVNTSAMNGAAACSHARRTA